MRRTSAGWRGLTPITLRSWFRKCRARKSWLAWSNNASEKSSAHPFRIGDAELRVSAKFGIAMFPDDGADADTLFRNAEAALKKAKASGERYLFYTQTMNERSPGSSRWKISCARRSTRKSSCSTTSPR